MDPNHDTHRAEDLCHRRREMRAAVTSAIAAAFALATSPLRADPLPSAREVLEADALHARYWWVGYTSVYSAAALAQTGIALTAYTEGERVDYLVGAASSWLGVGGMLLSTIPRVERAAAEARRTGRWDEGLARAAEAESLAFAWYNHLACAAVAVAAGAVLWLGYDRPGPAALNFASNLVIGEINLFTAPRRAMRRRARAAQGWRVAPAGGGFVVSW